jgi:hypothetical protein
METVKIIALLVEWGPVGVLAGMLFYLIREQSRQHTENISNLTTAHVESMTKLTDTMLIQSELLDEVKSVAKIARKEAYEHRRKFEDYRLESTTQHARLEVVLGVIKDDVNKK